MFILRRIWTDIRVGHNLDIYITFVLAVSIAFLSGFQIVDISIVLSAVLATSALVSVSLLTNRHDNQYLRESISKLDHSRGLANSFFATHYDREVLKVLVKDEARQLIFWATNSTSTFPLIKESLEAGLKNGLNAKFLFLEPDSEAARMHEFRNRYQDIDEVNSVLRSNLSTLGKIKERIASGILEVRTINYLPSFTLVAIDPYLPSGRMFVRLLTFRIPNEERPVFELTRNNDPEWFDYFLNQFDLVWAASSPPLSNSIQVSQPKQSIDNHNPKSISATEDVDVTLAGKSQIGIEQT